eukprot:6212837-Pleurochrysis_carterae.AAC.3
MRSLTRLLSDSLRPIRFATARWTHWSKDVFLPCEVNCLRSTRAEANYPNSHGRSRIRISMLSAVCISMLSAVRILAREHARAHMLPRTYTRSPGRVRSSLAARFRPRSDPLVLDLELAGDRAVAHGHRGDDHGAHAAPRLEQLQCRGEGGAAGGTCRNTGRATKGYQRDTIIRCL